MLSGIKELAQKIDHTLLRPEATPQEIERLCHEALKHQFACVVVNPCYVNIAARLLRDSQVEVGTVISFPFGSSSTATKIFEAQNAVHQGAQHLDMVINIGLLKAGDFAGVREDIQGVAEKAKPLFRKISDGDKELILKVIIEAGLLSKEEKKIASQLVVEAGGDFVKTNTGYLGTGATVEDVILIRRVVGENVGIKASGGIRTLAQAEALIAASADRLGTSSGMQIINELVKRGASEEG